MTLARVEQLFALACSTAHEEEARTAAIAGVRLMRKLGLQVQAPRSWTPIDHLHDLRAEHERQKRDRAQADAFWRDVRSQRVPAPNGGVWGVILRGGWCAGCGERFEAGQRVYKVNAEDVWCSNC